MNINDKVTPINSIPYFMGQCASDKILKGEVVTIEPNVNGMLQFKEIPNRYGPFNQDSFKKVK